ncbi:MAG: mechanosensitive ion channel family protein [Cocleimonas sp.]|nr:mechanosensitive ion channel family protein [Cocleimonas sp.]
MELIEQLKQSLQPTLDTVLPYVKEGWGLLNDYAYLRAGILIFIGYFVARLLSKHIPLLIIKLAQKVNFSLGEEIAKLTRPLIFQVVFLSSIGLVANLLELSETQQFIALASIKSLIIIFFILFVFKLIKLFLKGLAEKGSNDEDGGVIQPATLPLFENITLLFLALGGIHQVFGVWNVDMTALLASAGIAGLAIGMASKDTLSDVIAGILILTDAPYRVGDVIQIGAQVGTVASIGIRSTRIITKDNVGITVPNGKMGASDVINESSAEDTSLRIKLAISAAYGVDPAIIRDILITAANETKQVKKDKKISAVLSDFQQDKITFTLLCWISEPTLKSGALSALREKIYIRFLQDNIPISAPDRREIAITKQANLKQEVSITSIPVLEQSIAVKEIPALIQSISVKEMPTVNQSVSIKDIPDLVQSVSIKDIPELIQSVAIKEMPELAHSVAITEIPELIQSVSIKDIPELIQSIMIKEMPDRNGTLSIKEIPDLFGSGQVRKIFKPSPESNETTTNKSNPPTEKTMKPESKKE